MYVCILLDLQSREFANFIILTFCFLFGITVKSLLLEVFIFAAFRKMATSRIQTFAKTFVNGNVYKGFEFELPKKKIVK